MSLRSIYLRYPHSTHRKNVAITLITAIVLTVFSGVLGWGVIRGFPMAHAATGTCAEVAIIGDERADSTVNASNLAQQLSTKTGVPTAVYTQNGATINNAVSSIYQIRSSSVNTQRCYIIDLGTNDLLSEKMNAQQSYHKISALRSAAGPNDLIFWVAPAIKRGNQNEVYFFEFQQALDGAQGDGTTPVIVGVPWNQNVRADDFANNSAVNYTQNGYKVRGNYIFNTVSDQITAIENSGAVKKGADPEHPDTAIVDPEGLKNSPLKDKIFQSTLPDYAKPRLRNPNIRWPNWRALNFSHLVPSWFCEKYAAQVPGINDQIDRINSQIEPAENRANQAGSNINEHIGSANERIGSANQRIGDVNERIDYGNTIGRDVNNAFGTDISQVDNIRSLNDIGTVPAYNDWKLATICHGKQITPALPDDYRLGDDSENTKKGLLARLGSDPFNTDSGVEFPVGDGSGTAGTQFDENAYGSPSAFAVRLGGTNDRGKAISYLPSIRWENVQWTELEVGQLGGDSSFFSKMGRVFNTTVKDTANGIILAALNVAFDITRFLTNTMFRGIIMLVSFDMTFLMTRIIDFLMAMFGGVVVPFGVNAKSVTAIIVFSAIIAIGIITILVSQFILKPISGEPGWSNMGGMFRKILTFIASFILVVFMCHQSMSNYSHMWWDSSNEIIMERGANEIGNELKSERTQKGNAEKTNVMTGSQSKPALARGGFVKSEYHVMSWGWVTHLIFMFAQYVVGVFSTIANAMIRPLNLLLSKMNINAAKVAEKSEDLVPKSTLRDHVDPEESNCNKYMASLRNAYLSTGYANYAGNSAAHDYILTLDDFITKISVIMFQTAFGGATRSAANGWCWAAENIINTPAAEWAMVARGAGLYTEALGVGSLYGRNSIHALPKAYVNTGVNQDTRNVKTYDGVLLYQDGTYNHKTLPKGKNWGPVILKKYMRGDDASNRQSGRASFYYSACEWRAYTPGKSKFVGAVRGYLSEDWWGAISAATNGYDTLSADNPRIKDYLNPSDGEQQAKDMLEAVYGETVFSKELEELEKWTTPKTKVGKELTAVDPTFNNQTDSWMRDTVNARAFSATVFHRTPLTWQFLNHAHCQALGLIPRVPNSERWAQYYGFNAYSNPMVNSWNYTGGNITTDLTYISMYKKESSEDIDKLVQESINSPLTGESPYGGKFKIVNGVINPVEDDEYNNDHSKPMHIKVEEYLNSAQNTSGQNPALDFVYARVTPSGGQSEFMLTFASIIGYFATGLAMIFTSIPILIASVAALVFSIALLPLIFASIYNTVKAQDKTFAPTLNRVRRKK